MLAPATVDAAKKYPNIKELSFIKGFFVEYDGPSHRKFVAREEEVKKFRATKPPVDAGKDPNIIEIPLPWPPSVP